MKALLLTDYRKLQIADLPVPEVGPEEVLIRVRACGICGSDVHGYDGSTGRRIPPLVMGHEAAGIVERVGAEVTDLAVGTPVTFDSTIWCGKCFFCHRGQTNLCDYRRVLGVSTGEYRQYGAFAEYVCVPRRIVYRLPASFRLEEAAMIEAVSVALHGVGRLPLVLGDSAVVVGTGMIGLLVLQALKAAGCGQVLAIDVEDAKLDLAKKLGADETINSKQADAPALVASRTDGRGADLAVECVGATAPVQTAIAVVRKGGSVSLVGNLSPQIEIPLQTLVTRQITLHGSCASSGEYPAAIELMASRRIDVAPLISARAPLEEGPEWFDRLYHREPGLMKVVLEP